MVNLTINNMLATIRCLINIQDLNVESAEVIVQRIRKHNWLAPKQTLITSSCGLSHLPLHIAFGKPHSSDGGGKENIGGLATCS